jgi:hypothetical protein
MHRKPQPPQEGRSGSRARGTETESGYTADSSLIRSARITSHPLPSLLLALMRPARGRERVSHTENPNLPRKVAQEAAHEANKSGTKHYKASVTCPLLARVWTYETASYPPYHQPRSVRGKPVHQMAERPPTAEPIPPRRAGRLVGALPASPHHQPLHPASGRLHVWGSMEAQPGAEPNALRAERATPLRGGQWAEPRGRPAPSTHHHHRDPASCSLARGRQGEGDAER